MGCSERSLRYMHPVMLSDPLASSAAFLGSCQPETEHDHRVRVREAGVGVPGTDSGPSSAAGIMQETRRKTWKMWGSLRIMREV
jgi:hypothetical protein